MREYTPPPLKTLVLYVSFGDEPKPQVESPDAHFVKVVPPFGPVPEELEEIYPLWQHEVPRELDREAIETTVQAVRRYLEVHAGAYEKVILIADSEWVEFLRGACSMVSEKLTVQER